MEAELESGGVVFAERTQIQQVLVNLLSNAVHALEVRKPGDRLLAVALRGRDRAEISVRDNGRGIPSDRQRRIFEPYFTTRIDGLGMGLAISRSIVEAHDGEISVESDEGSGATFRVSLPLDSVARVAIAESNGRTAESKSRARAGDTTLCIVDDDEASRDGVARLLVAAGWSVLTFDCAAAALASPALSAAKCLLFDVQMPGMSGLELHTECVRRGFDVPVIFLTARDDAATGVEAMKHGAIEYLTKPVDNEVLLGAVRKGLHHHAERLRIAHERVAVEKRVARLTPRELEVLKYVIVGRLNKQIAADLSIGEATVKQHRGQVMKKMEARSLAELVRSCQTIGLMADSRSPCPSARVRRHDPHGGRILPK